MAVAAVVAGLATLGGLLAGNVLSAQQEDVYETDATVIVTVNSDDTDGQVGALVDSIDVLNPNIVGTYVQILSSRSVLEAVEAEIAATYGPVAAASLEILVRPIESSSVIVISATGPDAQLVADAANGVVDTAANSNPATELSMAFPLAVLDTAQVPDEPVFPLVRDAEILGGLAGLIVGLTFAIWWLRRSSTRTRVGA